MATSDAATVEEYLDGLDRDDRETIETVRQTVLDNLPDGYDEQMRWGMITWEVPLETSGPTYNGKPLMYAALARQAKYFTLYLTAPYSDPEGALEDFRSAYKATGKKLDMGKSCVRFRALDDLPLDVVGDEIARLPVDDFLAQVEQARAR